MTSTTTTKIRWWLDSVRGLKAHVGIYRTMHRMAQRVPPKERTEALMEQLRRQQEMVGICLLSVLLIHPAGSGRFWD